MDMHLMFHFHMENQHIFKIFILILINYFLQLFKKLYIYLILCNLFYHHFII